MHICIITANHLRRQVLELFCLSMDRIRKDSNLDIHVICATDRDQAQILSEHKIEHIPMYNKPVANKFQSALTRAKHYSPECVMILGSDDVIETNAVVNAYNVIKSGCDVAGKREIYFYSTSPGTAGMLLKHTSRMLFGAGKVVGAGLLDKIDWTLWHVPANSGLDMLAIHNINQIEHTESEYEGMLVDVKTRTNLNRFDFWKNKNLEKVDENIFLTFVSEQERSQLKAIIKRQTI